MSSHKENERCQYCDKTYSSETEVDADIRLKEKRVSFQQNQRTMALEDVRTNTRKLKSAFLGQMESRLSAMIDDVMDNVQKTEYPERILMMSDPSMMKDKRKASIAGRLPEKEFRSRPSPLTELLEVPHIRSILHIFIAALCLLMLHTILTDIMETGTVDLGFERLMWTFGKPLTTLKILISMEIFALFILFPSFYYWSTKRLNYKTETRRMIDYVAAGTFATFLLGFMYFPARALLRDPLGPASGALVSIEQGRLLMKMYAFVRSNVPKALMFSHKNETESNKATTTTRSNTTVRGILEDGASGENDGNGELRKRVVSPIINERNSGLELVHDGNNGTGTTTVTTSQNGTHKIVAGKVLRRQESWISWDDEKTPCPSYSRYLYFFFAPTLIYKDNYPRTSSTNWNLVCSNFAQVFGCIFYGNMVLGKACSVYFSKVGLPDHPMTPTILCNAVFSLMVPGTLGLMLGFYLLLHSWHNAFAEMLRFGDRLFYKDWWNASSFGDYYKTWNVLVHDWLYTYVFKDAWESGLGQGHISKAFPTFLVFFVSSLFHEYILAFSLSFFLPCLLLLFGGFGFALAFVKNAKGAFGNVFMWLGLMSGCGILVSTYCIEYFARLNCPSSTEGSVRDFFTPRSFSCGVFQWS